MLIDLSHIVLLPHFWRIKFIPIFFVNVFRATVQNGNALSPSAARNMHSTDDDIEVQVYSPRKNNITARSAYKLTVPNAHGKEKQPRRSFAGNGLPNMSMRSKENTDQQHINYQWMTEV